MNLRTNYRDLGSNHRENNGWVHPLFPGCSSSKLGPCHCHSLNGGFGNFGLPLLTGCSSTMGPCHSFHAGFMGNPGEKKEEKHRPLPGQRFPRLGPELDGPHAAVGHGSHGHEDQRLAGVDPVPSQGRRLLAQSDGAFRLPSKPPQKKPRAGIERTILQ